MRRFLLRAALFCAFAALPPAELVSADNSLREGLEWGPHKVGFQTIEQYDYSRVYIPPTDYLGHPRAGIRARPIQTCIWYPASAAANGAQMTYGEYAFPYPQDERFISLLTSLQNREIQALFAIFGGEAEALGMMSVPMAAMRAVTPAEGSFPLIIYFPDYRQSYCNNAVCCEYLASHGYVIMTTPSLGMSSADAEANQADLENQIRDREFALALLSAGGLALNGKIGLLGSEAGGLGALCMQMRNPDITAVISLNGWFVAKDKMEFSRQCASFNPRRMIAPLLQICASDSVNLNFSIFEALQYSPRYLAVLSEPAPAGFADYPMLGIMADSSLRAISRQQYGETCLLIKRFFDAALCGNPQEIEYFNTVLTGPNRPAFINEYRTYPAQTLPPTIGEFFEIINAAGIDTAAALYRKFRTLEPEWVFFQEGQMNIMGYTLLQRGDYKGATVAFQLNTEAYPQSANTWDSLSDAYLNAGDNENAIVCMKKALELLPSDTVTAPELKEQIRTKCEHMLQSLESQ